VVFARVMSGSNERYPQLAWTQLSMQGDLAQLQVILEDKGLHEVAKVPFDRAQLACFAVEGAGAQYRPVGLTPQYDQIVSRCVKDAVDGTDIDVRRATLVKLDKEARRRVMKTFKSGDKVGNTLAVESAEHEHCYDMIENLRTFYGGASEAAAEAAEEKFHNLRFDASVSIVEFIGKGVQMINFMRHQGSELSITKAQSMLIKKIPVYITTRAIIRARLEVIKTLPEPARRKGIKWGEIRSLYSEAEAEERLEDFSDDEVRKPSKKAANVTMWNDAVRRQGECGQENRATRQTNRRPQAQVPGQVLQLRQGRPHGESLQAAKEGKRK